MLCYSKVAHCEKEAAMRQTAAHARRGESAVWVDAVQWWGGGAARGGDAARTWVQILRV